MREKILFREDGWFLIRSSTISDEDRARCFTHNDANFFMFESVIKHRCPFDGIDIRQGVGPNDSRHGEPGGMSFLDEEDSVMGMCWWCMTAVPNDLNALFKLQNWEAMLKVHVSETWGEEDVEGRKSCIRSIQRDIKNGEWDGTGGRAMWRSNNADYDVNGYKKDDEKL